MAKLQTFIKFAIPRCYSPVSFDKVSLHIFSDASKEAYACVAYLRVESNSGVFCAFVCAKTRVAPMKRETIPRLELLSCVLSARLLKYLTDSLGELSFSDIFLWTDSKVALSWIVNPKVCRGSFVQNRVREIRSLSSISDCNHVSGENNPVDCMTRFTSLVDVERWHSGPAWLSLAPSFWPVSQFSTDIVPELSLIHI